MLSWSRPSPGFAVTECGRYQMSISRDKNEQPRYLVVARSESTMQPWRVLGMFTDPKQARQICEDDNAK